MITNQMQKVLRYRVRKENMQAQQIVKPDGLSECLECWKNWMLSDDRDLSASKMKFHACLPEDDDDEHHGYESDPYFEQRRDDMKIGEATGVMIDDLKPVLGWAIRKKMGICLVWRFESADFISCLEQAEKELEKKLRNHIVTGMKF